MNKPLLTFAIVLLVYNADGASPLIFKATKVLESVGTVELGTFDATRFSQIRVGILIESTGTTPSSAMEAAQVRYDSAERAFERTKRLFGDGVISRDFYDRAKTELDLARVALEQTPDDRIAPASIAILGVVGSDEIPLARFASPRISESVLMEVPPSTVRIRVHGKGKFSVYVWGR